MQLVAPSHKETVQEFYRDQLVAKNQSTYLEFPVSKKNREQLWVGLNAKTLFDDENAEHVSGFLAVVRDITGRIQMGGGIKTC